MSGAAGGGVPVVAFADEAGDVAAVVGVVGAAEDELDLAGAEHGGGVLVAVAGADLGEGLEDRDDRQRLSAAVGEQVRQGGDGCDVGALVEQEQHGWVHPSAGGAGGGAAGDVGDVLDECGHEAGGGAGAAVGGQAVEGAGVAQQRRGGHRWPASATG